MAQGSSTKLIYATESVFGTAPAAGNYTEFPFVSESLKYKKNFEDAKKISSNRNPSALVGGKISIAGDINFELSWQHHSLFYHVMGNRSTSISSGVETDIYQVGSLPVGLTLEKQFTDLDGVYKYFRYRGCRVNSFKAAFKPEGTIDCTLSLLGKAEDLAVTSVDAAPDDLGHDPFDGFQAAITDKDGNSLGDIVALDFAIENQLATDHYLIGTTGERDGLPEGKSKITGSLKALFSDVTLYNLAKDETESSIKIVLTRGDGSGSEGNEQIIIQMNEVQFQPSTPGISGPQGLFVELPFHVYYLNDAEASALILMVKYATSAEESDIVVWETGTEWEGATAGVEWMTGAAWMSGVGWLDSIAATAWET